jgi:hypothetical protein
MATTTTTTTTPAAEPIPCGPYLQVLLTRAADALDHSLIPAWDEQGLRDLHGLRQGRWQPYWTSTRRRLLSQTDEMACAALMSFAATAQGPAWANTEADDARRLALAIREGRCAIW